MPSRLSFSRDLGMYWQSLIFIFSTALGCLIGFQIAQLPFLVVLFGAVGIVLLGASVIRIEYPFYLLLICSILFAVEPPSGSIFEYLTDMKFPGVPTFVEMLAAVLVLSFAVRSVLRKGKVSVPLLNYPVLVFLALFAISFSVGWLRGVDSVLLKEDAKKFLFPVLMFICCVNILNSDARIRYVAFFSLFLGVVKSCLGNIYYLKGYGFSYGDMNVVFLSSGDHLVFVTVILVSISLMIHKKLRGGKLLLLILANFPMIFTLIFSFRRNTWLGVIFSLGILFLLTRGIGKMKMIMFTLCGVLAVTGLFSLSNVVEKLPSKKFLINRFTSIGDREESSNVSHYEEWRVTLEDIARNPIMGLGLGSQHSPVPGNEVLNKHTVHNAFIMLWMKMGIFSLILFVYYLIRYLGFAIKAVRAKEGYDLKPLQIGLLSTFGYWIVALNVGPSWFYYQDTFLMGLVAAVVVNLSRLRNRSVSGSESERIQAGTEANAGI